MVEVEWSSDNEEQLIIDVGFRDAATFGQKADGKNDIENATDSLRYW